MEQSSVIQSTNHLTGKQALLKVLLACGVASSLVYGATEILASASWPGYDRTSRMVSDLFAVSAPTRSFIVVPMLVYNLLILAFGTGVWFRAWNRCLRIAGAILIAYGIVSILGLLVFPLNYAAEGANATMHMVDTFALILLMFAFIAFAAAGAERAFRIYSLATVTAILAGAILAGSQIPRVDAGLPTPGLGVFERLNIYSMLLWVAVFSVLLLRSKYPAKRSNPVGS
jgi:hypothetical protein